MVSWGSSGTAGFKGSRKGTPYAAQMAAQGAAAKAKEQGLRQVEVFVRGPGSGREAAIRAIQASGISVTGIRDVTPVPHNGCRPRKRKASINMARYIEAYCRLCRRTGGKLMLKGERCFAEKCAVERGILLRAPTFRQRQGRSKVSDRGIQLMEKQKAKYTYGIFERQFRRFFEEASRRGHHRRQSVDLA